MCLVITDLFFVFRKRIQLLAYGSLLDFHGIVYLHFCVTLKYPSTDVSRSHNFIF
jgi:hypothetical protein